MKEIEKDDDMDEQSELKGKIAKRKMTKSQQKMAGKACPLCHGKVLEAGD